MIAIFRNQHEAEKRFNQILARAERESSGVGTSSFMEANPVRFDSSKQLITIYFQKFTAFYQRLGDAIELWMNAEQGIDDGYVTRKMTNMFNALRSSTQHRAPEEETEQLPEKESVSLFDGAELSDDSFERNLALLGRWLVNHNMTILQLEEKLGLLPNAILRQLRRSKYGKFKTWWRHNIILGGNND